MFDQFMDRSGAACLTLLLLAGCVDARPSGDGADAGGSCAHSCPADGTRSCRAGGRSLCADYDGDGCREWGPANPCPDGQVCQDGSCRVEAVGCQSECEAGERECVGTDSSRECGYFDEDPCLEWSQATPCQQGSTCSGGTCPTVCQDACEAGTRECEGESSYRLCGRDDDVSPCLAFGPAQACPEGERCRSGECQQPCSEECPLLGDQACADPGATHTCGDFDDDECLEWGPSSPCAEGLVCERGQCRLAPCTDDCEAAGDRECLGDRYRVCGAHDDDPCLDWGAPEVCPADHTCSEGLCQQDCEDDCDVDGELRCHGDQARRRCGQYDSDLCLDWSSLVPCGEDRVCAEGECVPSCSDDCLAGAVRCADATHLSRCGNWDADGCLEWGEPEACGDFQRCDDPQAACVLDCEHECAAGAARCPSAEERQLCGAHDEDPCLDWGPAEQCPAGQRCSADTGRCSPPSCSSECEQGERRCAPGGSGVQLCGEFDDDACHEWGEAASCGPGTVCADGACVLACRDDCDREERVCADARTVRVCGQHDEDPCLDWGPPEECGEHFACEFGQCRPDCQDTCDAADQLGCSGDASARQRCGEFDGDPCLEWGDIQACPPGHTCSNGVCAPDCVDECEAGGRRCSGNGVATCGQYDADACLDWSQAVACQPWELCVDGVCLLHCEDECLPGSTRCLDAQTVQPCGNFDGDPCREYALGGERCPEGQTCDDDACVAVRPPQGVVINELLVDGPGGDAPWVFVELAGPPGMSLRHYSLEGVNGANGVHYAELSLDGASLGPDGLFVVAHPEANPALRAEADLLSELADFQNGPDSLRLLWAGHEAVDALGYGFLPGAEHFAGESRSADPVVVGLSYSRDEASVDTDVNVWDFQPGQPTAGHVRGSGWAVAPVGSPAPEDAPPLWRPDLRLDAGGLLSAAFVGAHFDAVYYGLGDPGGNDWLVETVHRQATLPLRDGTHVPLYWHAPLAVHPDGDAAVAMLGFVQVQPPGEPALAGRRGVLLGYGSESAGSWAVEWVVEIDEEELLPARGRWIWQPGGVAMATAAGGELLLAFLEISTVDEPATTLRVLRREAAGEWTEELALRDANGAFSLAAAADGVHLVYVGGDAEAGYDLRRALRSEGAWAAAETVHSPLHEPGDLCTFVDGERRMHVCVVDFPSLDADPDTGVLLGGDSAVLCSPEDGVGLSLHPVITSRRLFLPTQLSAAWDPIRGGTALALYEHHHQALWALRPAAAGEWERSVVQFGGETGVWPTLAVTAEGTYQILSGSVNPLKGVLHAHD